MPVAGAGMVYVADSDNHRTQRFFEFDSRLSGTNMFTDSSVGPVDVGVGSGQLLRESRLHLAKTPLPLTRSRGYRVARKAQWLRES